MSFDERNEAWEGKAREFRQLQSRSTAPRIWTIQVVGKTIITTSGQLGGAIQQFEEVMGGVNIGKKNEKSPEQYALERARETARKKNWEGYREFEKGKPLDELVSTEIDFDDLPLSLSFYKPSNVLSGTMEKKATAGKVLYSRKRNGLAFVLSRGKEHPRLYSRKMLRQDENEVGGGLTWNDRFPHLIEAARLFMPEYSILLGELVMNRPGGVDDFSYVQSIFQNPTLGARQKQKEEGYLSFYIWDVAFWNGLNMVKTSPVRARYELIHELPYGQEAGFFSFLPVEYYTPEHFKTPELALEFAKEKGFEGWVVVDPDGVYGEKAFNFKGKPDRPGDVCGKLKPEYEDDFVAFWDPDKEWGERSTKKRNDQGIKCVALFQYNKEGQLTFISNVSSGLTDAQKKDWANTKRWPRTWRVSYKDRRYMSQGEDTNALDFASFEEERSDKKPEECINHKL